jgi:gingipain R
MSALLHHIAFRRHGKNWLLLLLVLMLSAPAFTQNVPCFTLLSASSKKMVLRFQIENIRMKNVSTARGKAQIPLSAHGVLTQKKGAPLLPRYVAPLIIPSGTRLKIRVISTRFHDTDNIVIAPSKRKIFRHDRLDSIPYAFGKIYDHDRFFSEKVWDTTAIYRLEGHRCQNLIVFPLAYHPIQKVLQVYDEITFEITFQPQKDKTHVVRETRVNNLFSSYFRQHFFTFPTEQKSGSATRRKARLLIICRSPFVPLLSGYIRWKQQTGFDVMVKAVSSRVTADSIRSCICKEYRQKGVDYVLLAGDAAQIPSGTAAGHPSDNFYTYVDGNDHYPDIFIGRFPAENAEQLKIMISRTLAYEKAQSADSQCYSKAVGIASEAGPGYQNLMDYQHIRFIDSAYLSGAVHQKVTELFDGSYGPPDAAGNPDTQMLTSAIEEGTGIINYCGHGSAIGWNTTHFDTAAVNRLNNTGSWPFILSVSCATGDFVHGTCFAESWLRAEKNGKPTGAVAALMPSAAQSWDAPMCAQQEMNRLLTLPDSVSPPATFGALCTEGCIKMNNIFGSEGYETTDTWVLFGDPSLQLRTAIPQPVRAVYPKEVPDTARFLTVHTPLQTGCATLSDSARVLATAWPDAKGDFRLPLDSVPDNVPLQLVVTARNHRPFFGKTIKENTTATQPLSFLSGFCLFPNPATPQKTITVVFALQRPHYVTLTLSDTRGNIIRTLFSGRLSAGRQRFLFRIHTSGLFFLHLQSGGKHFSKKVVVQ